MQFETKNNSCLIVIFKWVKSKASFIVPTDEKIHKYMVFKKIVSDSFGPQKFDI